MGDSYTYMYMQMVWGVQFNLHIAYLSTLLIWAVLYWFWTPKLLSTDLAPDLNISTD